MKLRTITGSALLAGALCLSFPAGSSAFVQTNAIQGFETNAPDYWPVSATAGFVTNLVNTTNNWVINDIRLVASATNSGSFGARFNPADPTNAWVRTPFLSNGVGSIVFYRRMSPSGFTNILNIEGSYDGTTWFTNAVVTNALTTHTAYTNLLNTYSNQYLRFRQITNNASFNFYLDDILISSPAAIVTISNVTLNPAQPVDMSPVSVSSPVGVRGVLTTLSLTNYWREWPSANWSGIAMASNQASVFTNSTPLPAKPIGAVIEYYVEAAYDWDTGMLLTNTARSSYMVRPRANYSSLSVTGAVTTNLLLGGNYQWQRAVAVSNLADGKIKFSGVSNTVTTLWGDLSQPSSSMPVYGTADVGATNITLFGTNTGFLVFNFNESNLVYSVFPCAYANFDAWPPASSSNDQWVLSDGVVTNDSSRTFSASGASAVLNGAPNASTNSFLRSPYRTNGIGQISFRHRNWETNGSPAGELRVQVAASDTSTNWATIASVTNIVSTNYLWFSLVQADLQNHCVRILNNASGTNARVCVDEVVVADPSAGVRYSNLTNSPSPATVLNAVNISVDVTTVLDAVITNMVCWFRLGTNGMFESIPMATNGSLTHYQTAITNADAGVVQYAVQCFYSGFQSELTSPVFFPSGGTNQPQSYAVSQPSGDYRTQGFETNAPDYWPISATAAYVTNLVATNNWVINDIRLVASAANSGSFGARFNRDDPTNAWVRSPFLSNGVGSIVFYRRVNSSGYTNLLNIEGSYDGATWFTNAVATNFYDAAQVAYTNILNLYSNQYLRFRQLSNNPAAYFYLDDITVFYPAARVAITNVFINPGYPSATNTVSVYCDITSVNPIFPAYAIAPTLWYKRSDAAGYASIRMTRAAGNTYRTTADIPAFPRDIQVNYFIQCDFTGYRTVEDGTAPTFYASSNSPASYIVRPSYSSFSNVAAVVNGQVATNTSRMLANGLWQSVVNLSAATNSLAISWNGYGQWTGIGLSATNVVTWGQTNAWQTALPLSDSAGTNQAPVVITGSFTVGQYVIRFDEQTGQYLVIPCVWQDFDNWSDTGVYYVRQDNNATVQNVVNNFDTWATNLTRVRSESFNGGIWPTFTSYTNGGNGGTLGFMIYGSLISAGSVKTTNVASKGVGFVVQPSHWPDDPLRGIGSVQYAYKASAISPTATVEVFLFPTNNAPYLDPTLFPADVLWGNPVPNSTVTFAQTNGFLTNTVTIQTNATFDIIIAHDSGDQSIYLDNLSVSEWYADTQTNGGWIASDSWIETSLKAGMGVCCRFDPTRAWPGTNQYIQTPMLTSGVYSLSFQHCSASAIAVSFIILASYGDANHFTNVLDAATNSVGGSGTNYSTYAKTFKIQSTNVYLRFMRTTNTTGVLLLDDFKITPYISGETWAINNAAIDAGDQKHPPDLRQFYAGACYLNSNRFSEISSNPTDAPDTNDMPSVRAPYMNGVGEISFWYRNWAVGSAPAPAKILVQSTPYGTTNWSTQFTITNVVNTNDYLFFQDSLYTTNRVAIRICNDDTYTDTVGRVCLDDILVTAPLACSLALSNLVITPAIPLYSNTVNVAVDVHRVFLSPSNFVLTAYYGAATNYAGLSSNAVTSLGMACISNNLTVPGRWYRYQTTNSIPATNADIFVRYFVQAEFAGYHSEATSPMTNRSLTVPPTWYAPLPTNGMAYYVVFSCPTGSVWINEFNVKDFSDGIAYQYVELCGKADINLTNWSLQVLNTLAQTQTVYLINSNTVIQSITNGFGFWVIGKTSVTNRQQTLTSDLPNAGGLRLMRISGSMVDAICYTLNSWDPGAVSTLTNKGFRYAGFDHQLWDTSVILTGTNTLGFSWELGPDTYFSPGGINDYQYLIGVSQSAASPTVTIVAFWINTNVWIESATTNNWAPTPWYTTNLMNTNSWTNVAPFWTTFPTLSPSNTVRVNFAIPTNTVPYFYRIVATNAP